MTSLYRRTQRLIADTALHGYECAELIDTIVAKTERYIPGKFDNMELYNTLTRLQPRTVLDFGGGAGVHWKQASYWGFAPHWTIVETPSMVSTMRQNASHLTPRWVDHINLHNQIDLIICNGALQYHPTPNLVAEELASLNAKEILYQRLHFTGGLEISYLSDHGPGPAWGPEALVYLNRHAFDRDEFLAIHSDYRRHSLSPTSDLFELP